MGSIGLGYETGDFHEAYVSAIATLPDTTIVVGHSDR